MLEGRCLNCCFSCYGWALRNPRHQTCPNCGSALEITDSDGTIFEGYSPFTADEYFFESTRKIIHPEHNDQSIKGN